MSKPKTITLTGKVKKMECVKGTDRLVIENLDFPAEGIMQLKSCSNKEQAVTITITPVQQDLPGIDE